jgi:hypothetical protein
MNDAINKTEPLTLQIFKNFRYELLKLVIFIIIFAATIIYANSESGKYYSPTLDKSASLNK